MCNTSIVAHGSRLDRWMVGIALASATAFLALAAPALSGDTFGIDRQVKSYAGHVQHPMLGAGMSAVSTLGEAAGMIPLILLASALAWRYCRRYALVIPAVMTGAGLLQFAAKWAVDRPRPNLSPLGFPSGHVLCLVVLFGMIGYVLSVADVGRRVQRSGIALCAATVLAVAISRLYLDAHWLSDVMGGFAIGFAYLATVVRFIPGRPRRALELQMDASALELADEQPALAPIR